MHDQIDQMDTHTHTHTHTHTEREREGFDEHLKGNQKDKNKKVLID